MRGSEGGETHFRHPGAVYEYQVLQVQQFDITEETLKRDSDIVSHTWDAYGCYEG